MTDRDRLAPESVADRIVSVLTEAADDDRLPCESVRRETGVPHPLVVLERPDGRSVGVEVVPRSMVPFRPPAARGSGDPPIVARTTATDAFVFPPASRRREPPDAAVNLRDSFADRVERVAQLALAADRSDEPLDEGDSVLVRALLRAYHAASSPRYEDLLQEAMANGRGVHAALEAWSGRIGIDPPDGSDRAGLAARWYPLLLAAEALLLAIRGGRDRPGLPGVRTEDVVSRLGVRAEAAMVSEGVDPVVTSATTPFDRFPEDRLTRRLLRELICALDRVAPLTPPDDCLGRLYEAVVPAAARKPAGAYFTDGRVARTLVRWALPDRDDIDDDPVSVLDPAAGSGRFLDAAADRLAAHDRPGDLHGVDVNPVVLQLAAVAHACRPGDVDRLRTTHASFFSIDATGSEMDGAADREAGTGGAPDRGSVDALVGNPPFIRAGDLPLPREHYRAHLEIGPETNGERPEISRRADGSAYFLTHGTRFLREGGRLGFVVPNKWFAAAYGEDLRTFLFDHYRLHAVIGFSARTFGDALVNAVLLLGERCGDPDVRDRTPVRFHRVDAPVDGTDLLATVTAPPDERSANGLALSRDPHGRTVTVRQGALRRDGPAKLTPYLNAPAPLLELIDEEDALCPLGDLAGVSRGVMTGANDFFFLSPREADDRGIEERFLRPAQKSIRGCDRPALESDDPDHLVVDVHDYATSILADEASGSPSERVKRALRRDGYHGLADYVADAEGTGRHTGRTCQRRSIWFDLGPLPTPDIFLPKLLRERVFPVRNRAGAVPSNAIDCLVTREGIDPDLLHGILLATISRTIMEVWGRDEAGMLQLMTYETETLPVPDLRQFSTADRMAVRDAAGRLESDPTDRSAQRTLDATVASALDRKDTLAHDRIRELRNRVRNRRIRGGDDVTVLVGDGP